VDPRVKRHAATDPYLSPVFGETEPGTMVWRAEGVSARDGLDDLSTEYRMDRSG
jgi:hypothetical protein